MTAVLPGVRVAAPAPAALAAAALVAQRLAHDVQNALVSSVALCELAALDHPACAEPLGPVRDSLELPRRAVLRPLRTLPTRSSQRPRVLGLWLAQLRREAAGVLAVEADPQQWSLPPLAEADWVQCLDNVTQNALDAAQALGPGHQRTLSAKPWSQAGWVGLTWTDDCGGCPDPAAAAAGTLQRHGGGHLGLGLAVAAAHLDAVGGVVTLQDAPSGDPGSPRRGLVVTLAWPAAPRSPTATTP